MSAAGEIMTLASEPVATQTGKGRALLVRAYSQETR